MRSVVKWLCDTEDLMKAHVTDNVTQDIQGIQDIQDIRIILIILIILISRDMDIRGMVIHIKST